MNTSTEPLEVCPALASAFELLGKRWTALILDVLARRPARFCEIGRAIPGISDRLLTERLKELLEAGLIEREAGGAGVSYRLTATGERLVPAFNQIRVWAQSRNQLVTPAVAASA